MAAAALAPGWLKRAFADASLGRPSPAKGLAPADDPRRPARPRLVIVVPEGDAWLRERMVGAWLLAPDEDRHLAPLALADVECARAKALADEGIELPKGDLLFVRIDREGRAAVAFAPLGSAHTNEHLTRELRRLVPVDHLTVEERDRLAAQAEKLRYDPIRGSTWNYYVGCGHSTPHDAAPTDHQSIIGCGMGSIGGEAARFLRFWTAPTRTP